MKILRLIFILFLCGCQEQIHQSENYQLTSVADLTLTASNHPHGYQKTNCFACHIPANIHTINRINAPSFDLAAPWLLSPALRAVRLAMEQMEQAHEDIF